MTCVVRNKNRNITDARYTIEVRSILPFKNVSNRDGMSSALRIFVSTFPSCEIMFSRFGITMDRNRQANESTAAMMTLSVRLERKTHTAISASPKSHMPRSPV